VKTPLNYQPKEDYLELLNLSIIFLGGKPHYGKTICAPRGLSITHNEWQKPSIV